MGSLLVEAIWFTPCWQLSGHGVDMSFHDGIPSLTGHCEGMYFHKLGQLAPEMLHATTILRIAITVHSRYNELIRASFFFCYNEVFVQMNII